MPETTEEMLPVVVAVASMAEDIRKMVEGKDTPLAAVAVAVVVVAAADYAYVLVVVLVVLLLLHPTAFEPL